jgi:tRNA U34 5-methylaminomethyl-2-thiouridine-forming methyltransferase MnmC
MNENTEIILTGDGSNTLFSLQFNEIYHSRHGAIAESKHVFIESGLAQFNHEPIHVFEVGFGTGLNALLAWDFAESNNRNVNSIATELC